MSDEEYRRFLQYVFDEYVRERLPRLRRYVDHPFRHKFWSSERLRRASALIRYLQVHCDDADDIYNTVKTERIASAIDAVEDACRDSKRLAEESGFMDALEAHFAEIVEGLTPEHLPVAEVESLRELGVADPKVYIAGQIFVIKAHEARRRGRSNDLAIAQRLSDVEERLGQAEEEHRKAADANEEPAKKSRRWFKGLGQIGQGAALSIADIALAVGVLHLPVSPETQTWGTVASVTTGVGMIATGAGELRGE